MKNKEDLGDLPNELRTNGVDYAVTALRGGASLIPYLGPTIAEFIGTTIPNQRIDRIARFGSELDRRLEHLEKKLSDALFNDEQFTDLFEEALRQASQSQSDERIGYIANMIVRSLSNEEIEFVESKNFLRILDGINDIEIIWLRYYAETITFGKSNKFVETHKEVLTPVIAFLNDPPETRDKQTLQDSYKEHLAQLGLLRREFKRDMQTDEPVFDRFTGAMEVSHYRLSELGVLLLRQIGLGEDE